MQRVYMDRHPGLYSEDTDYYIFYGLYFGDICEVGEFLKPIPYIEDVKLEGMYIGGYKCLKEVGNDHIYINGQWLENEDAVHNYINRPIKVHTGYEFD